MIDAGLFWKYVRKHGSKHSFTSRHRVGRIASLIRQIREHQAVHQKSLGCDGNVAKTALVCSRARVVQRMGKNEMKLQAIINVIQEQVLQLSKYRRRYEDLQGKLEPELEQTSAPMAEPKQVPDPSDTAKSHETRAAAEAKRH